MNLRKLADRVLAKFGFARRNAFSYTGAQANRLTLDWFAAILSADQETKGNMRTLRARGRELGRNNPVAKQYLNLLAANVIGSAGIQYQSRVRSASGDLDSETNRKVETAFKDWSKRGNCTVDGKLSLRAVEDLAVRSVATDGEVFVRHVPGFANRHRYAIQLIDADCIDHNYTRERGKNENEIRLGVEVDGWGRPVAYYVSPYHPSDFGGSLERERIPAEYITHLYDPARVNQTRGVTWFHSVMLAMRILEGYIEAELVAARTGASKMGFLKYKDDADFDPPDPSKTKIRFEAAPGTVEMLPPGMEFVEWKLEHPANAFPNFVQAVLRQIATGLGVSYNALANDLVGVNYSSIRAGLLTERDQWRRHQAWFGESFLQPIFDQWLPMALLSGELKLPSRDFRQYSEGRWQSRGWQWVDPLKDVQAAIMAVDAALDTRDDVISDRGGDFEETLEQLAEEKKLAEKYGIELQGSTTTPLLADKVPGTDDNVVDENDPNAAETKPLSPKRFAKMRELALAVGGKPQ